MALQHVASAVIIGFTNPPTLDGNDGGFLATTVDNGTGDYTITLKEPLALSEASIQATIVTDFVPGATVNVRFDGGTSIRLKFYNAAGAAADCSAAIVVARRVTGRLP